MLLSRQQDLVGMIIRALRVSRAPLPSSLLLSLRLPKLIFVHLT